MTREEIEEIATAAGKAAARAALIQMGVDPDKPTETQADLAYLRRLRILAERSVLAAILAVVGLAVTALWHMLSSRH